MAGSESVRRILEGEFEPADIEDDPVLYSMAERIYGLEALEEMGVTPPLVEEPMAYDQGPISSDVSLPEFIPDFSETKEHGTVNGWFITRVTIFSGVFGILGVILNSVVGTGYFLCSIGATSFRHICDPNKGNYKLVFEEGFTYGRMHNLEAWTKPNQFSGVDALLVIFFLSLLIIGIFLSKRSIHPSEETSIQG